MFIFSINNQEGVTVDDNYICYISPISKYEIKMLFNIVKFFKTHCYNENKPKTKFLWRKIVTVYNEKCYESYLRSQN